MKPLSTNMRAARQMAHAAAQFPYRAALANLPLQDDDSQTSLGWVEGTFYTRALRDGSFVELSLEPLTLRYGARAIGLNGVTYDDALAWLDDHLLKAGHARASSAGASYDLPSEVTNILRFADTSALSELASCFTVAQGALERFTSRPEVSAKSSLIRCWTHHFDLATSVQVRAGAKAHRASIRVGMSPGDKACDQPYFYIEPSLSHAEAAKATPAPWTWQSGNRARLVATGDALRDGAWSDEALDRFLGDGFAHVRQLLDLAGH